MVLSNKVINGRLRAVGDWWKLYAIQTPFDPSYQWRRIQRFPIKVHRKKLRRFNTRSVEDLAEVPVLVSFSGVGGGYHLYKLEELLGEQENWTAVFAESSIILTAKKNLGTLTLRETLDLKEPYYEEKKNGNYVYKFKAEKEVMDAIVQEYHYSYGVGGGKHDSEKKVIKNRVDEWAIKMYKAVVLAITVPTTLEELPTTEEVEQEIEADALQPPM